jgi:hypothetical protein
MKVFVVFVSYCMSFIYKNIAAGQALYHTGMFFQCNRNVHQCIGNKQLFSRVDI